MPSKRKRASPTPTTRAKATPLPDGYVPSHRPLIRPAIPSPASSAPKVVYVSTKTPFISAVKRVQSLLAASDKREAQAALDKSRKGKGVDIEKAAQLLSRSERADNAVTMKGTGKAVENVLRLGLHFQSLDGYEVFVTTGSVGTIDDVMKAEREEGDDQEAPLKDDTQGEIEVPRSRFRYTSKVEVRVVKRTV